MDGFAHAYHGELTLPADCDTGSAYTAE